MLQVVAVQNLEFGTGGIWGLFEHSEEVRGLVLIDLEIQYSFSSFGKGKA